MPFQRRNDENGNPLPPHPKGHQLHGKGLPRTACAQDCHVCILINCGIKYVHNDQGAVIFIHSQQDAVVIAHLITGKGITARSAPSQEVPLRAPIQLLFHRDKRQRGKERLLLPEMTGTGPHVLRQQELLHLIYFPLQVIHRGCSDRNQ